MEAEKAALDARLRLLHGMGCEVCILSETSNTVHGDRNAPLSTRPTLSEAEWPGFARALTETARHVAGEGLTPVYHHMGTVVQSGEDLERLLAQTGEELKLLLDTGHAALAGMDPGAVAARHAGRLRHLHLKNVRPPVAREAIEKDWSFLDAVRAGVFTVPGDAEGGVDAVLSGSRMTPDGKDGLKALEIAVAARRSAREHRAVRLEP